MTAPLKLAHIVAAVAEVWGFQPRDLRVGSKTRAVVEARWAVAKLARMMTDASYPMIARSLGDQDHGTAIHGVRRIDELLPDREDLRIRLDAAQAALLIIQKAGLAHLIDAIDAIAVARRIEARPERYAAMATANEITAMAQWIVDNAGPDQGPQPAQPLIQPETEMETNDGQKQDPCGQSARAAI